MKQSSLSVEGKTAKIPVDAGPFPLKISFPDHPAVEKIFAGIFAFLPLLPLFFRQKSSACPQKMQIFVPLNVHTQRAFPQGAEYKVPGMADIKMKILSPLQIGFSFFGNRQILFSKRYPNPGHKTGCQQTSSRLMLLLFRSLIHFPHINRNLSHQSSFPVSPPEMQKVCAFSDTSFPDNKDEGFFWLLSSPHRAVCALPPALLPAPPCDRESSLH